MMVGCTPPENGNVIDKSPCIPAVDWRFSVSARCAVVHTKDMLAGLSLTALLLALKQLGKIDCVCVPLAPDAHV